EFHERSLHADLGLALCLQAQSVLRPDLRVLVMSATIDSSRIAELMGNAPVVVSEGRAYPVETFYLGGLASGKVQKSRLEDVVCRAVIHALEQHPGDILVFLPGTREIRRTESKLHEMRLGSSVIVAPLHGSMQQEAQDTAIAPAPSGHRKVV